MAQDIIRNWGYQPGEKVRLRVANSSLGRSPDDAIARVTPNFKSQIPQNPITSKDNLTGTVIGYDPDPKFQDCLLISPNIPVFLAEYDVHRQLQVLELRVLRESPGNLERHQEVPSATLWRKLTFWK
jgi:hypothetical protein